MSNVALPASIATQGDDLIVVGCFQQQVCLSLNGNRTTLTPSEAACLASVLNHYSDVAALAANIRNREQCPECDGLGLHHMDDSPYTPCPTCGDRGWVPTDPRPSAAEESDPAES